MDDLCAPSLDASSSLPPRNLQSELDDASQHQNTDDYDNGTLFISPAGSTSDDLDYGGSPSNDDNNPGDFGTDSSTIGTSKLFRSRLQELPFRDNGHEEQSADLLERMEELLKVHRLLHRKLTKDWDGISRRLLDAEVHFGEKIEKFEHKIAALQATAMEMKSVQHKYMDALGPDLCAPDTGKLEEDIKALSLRTSELEGTVAGILARGSKSEIDHVELQLQLAKLAENVNAGTSEASQGHQDLQQEVNSLQKSVTLLERQIKHISQTADGQERNMRRLNAFLQILQNAIQRGYDGRSDDNGAGGLHLRYIRGLWSWDFGTVDRPSFPSFWLTCRRCVEYTSRVDRTVLLSVFFAFFALVLSIYTTDTVQTNEPAYMKGYFRRNVY